MGFAAAHTSMNRETNSRTDLLALYGAVRDGDLASARRRWEDAETVVRDRDEETAAVIGNALDDGDTVAAADALAAVLFVEDDPTRLDGPLASTVGTVLHAFGYLAAVVLFAGAHSREAVTDRLRLAYRLVGVNLQLTESVDETERTAFRCPYRTLGADRYGERRVCHDVLDRVDDGYVTYLERHRDIDYDRPRPCAESDCCYSEVTDA